ncbi:MAG: hypothetical protein UX09_C0006G0009 [Candidatus Uhrbacteria bacterium GW2011_GWE2_45_35]|uniref:Uncharacterized protein n=1 Tax=Candidatus Uhrbacteria bacterium GW2011_GWE2_45_35 TaxID=1618993 RepID=A0A0G1PU53_9BACT|nr:MAG: hypothetical protein UX09_C0006G0009 [Candidatus Uhrbacteria bacterium GW2011_GWE2_45_35]HBR81134.1 hypothetical protein [Candidatus Uhrbacteria bacterium]HCU31630.1 hypothetical protein [Candidatus Uhrbacteria bacterium]
MSKRILAAIAAACLFLASSPAMAVVPMDQIAVCQNAPDANICFENLLGRCGSDPVCLQAVYLAQAETRAERAEAALEAAKAATVVPTPAPAATGTAYVSAAPMYAVAPVNTAAFGYNPMGSRWGTYRFGFEIYNLVPGQAYLFTVDGSDAPGLFQCGDMNCPHAQSVDLDGNGVVSTNEMAVPVLEGDETGSAYFVFQTGGPHNVKVRVFEKNPLTDVWVASGRRNMNPNIGVFQRPTRWSLASGS